MKTSKTPNKKIEKFKLNLNSKAQKHNPNVDPNFWADCNLESSIKIKKDEIHGDSSTSGDIKSDKLKTSPLKKVLNTLINKKNQNKISEQLKKPNIYINSLPNISKEEPSKSSTLQSLNYFSFDVNNQIEDERTTPKSIDKKKLYDKIINHSKDKKELRTISSPSKSLKRINELYQENFKKKEKINMLKNEEEKNRFDNEKLNCSFTPQLNDTSGIKEPHLFRLERYQKSREEKIGKFIHLKENEFNFTPHIYKTKVIHRPVSNDYLKRNKAYYDRILWKNQKNLREMEKINQEKIKNEEIFRTIRKNIKLDGVDENSGEDKKIIKYEDAKNDLHHFLLKIQLRKKEESYDSDNY